MGSVGGGRLMSIMFKCQMCEKAWPYYDKTNVIIHYADDHQGNLMYLPDEKIKMMVDELELKS